MPDAVSIATAQQLALEEAQIVGDIPSVESLMRTALDEAVAFAQPANALPAWLANVPRFKWIDIPNSKPWTYFVDGKGVDPGYLNKLGVDGANYPQAPDFKLRFPANKYGKYKTRYPAVGAAGQGWPWGAEHTTFSGMALDDGRYSGRPANLMIGGGDAHWPDNTVVRFVFGVDAPRWEVAVLGAHFDEIKNEWPFDQTTFDPVRYPDDNPLHAKNYDGSRRGGHNYMDFWTCGQRDWLMAFESHQYWPVDMGRGLEVSIADFNVRDATGHTRWDTSKVPVVANLPVVPAQPDQPWKQKHPVTEDVWQLCNRKLMVWRAATNTYETAWTWTGAQWAWDDSAGGINADDEQILFYTWYSGSDEGTPGKRWWIFDIASKTRWRLTNVIGPHAQALPFASSHAPRGHGCLWCPDIGKWLYYMGPADAANIYTLERVDPITLRIDKLIMDGTPNNGQADRRAGGVLNNLQYCASLRGLVWMDSDRTGVRFMRT